jgi:nitrate/TMAO reductase-like tetraheme cytochrome c subunit
MIGTGFFRLGKRVRARLASASRLTVSVLFVAAAGTVGVGSVFAYRTYDYVQHDNDFCQSCHVMDDAFVRFESSIHRELGCKACHQPNMVERTVMALRQIVVNPEEVGVHAEVPDERCEHCHVEGDPEDWLLVRESVGHEIHLRSLDPVIVEMSCVTCHTTSLHDFHASSASCSQRGCHTEAQMHLGAMAEVEMNCVACHDFYVPVDASEAANRNRDFPRGELRPRAEQCLTCHASQEGMYIDPETEPHEAECGLCHNAHEQRRAVDAVRSCTEVLCHTVPESIEDEHHTSPTVRLGNCATCHEAHTFRIEGEDCASCHSELTIPTFPAAPPEAADTAGREIASLWTEPGPGLWRTEEWREEQGEPVLTITVVAALQSTQVTPSSSAFDHGRHTRVDCRNCHVQGSSLVQGGAEWCANCHHGGRFVRECTGCHRVSDIGAQTKDLVMRLPGGTEERPLEFVHGSHEGVVCADCHGSEPSAFAQDPSCLQCHERHHTTPTVDCLQCHTAPPDWAHEPVVVHEGCTGGVCHSRLEVPEAPSDWPRSVCEACHQDYVGADSIPPVPVRDTTVPPSDSL